MDNIILQDQEAITRLENILRDNSRVIARYDPTFAAVQILAADHLRTLIPVASSGRLHAKEQRQMALIWIHDQLENWPKDQPPPSQKQLWTAARIKIPDVSRANLLSQIPPEINSSAAGDVNPLKNKWGFSLPFDGDFSAHQ